MLYIEPHTPDHITNLPYQQMNNIELGHNEFGHIH